MKSNIFISTRTTFVFKLFVIVDSMTNWIVRVFIRSIITSMSWSFFSRQLKCGLITVAKCFFEGLFLLSSNILFFFSFSQLLLLFLNLFQFFHGNQTISFTLPMWWS